MPHAADQPHPFAACRMLHDVEREGPVIGRFADQPIYASVRDAWGRRYDYCGVIGRQDFKRFVSMGLRRGEFLLWPGVIYRIEDRRRSGPDLQAFGAARRSFPSRKRSE